MPRRPNRSLLPALVPAFAALLILDACRASHPAESPATTDLVAGESTSRGTDIDVNPTVDLPALERRAINPLTTETDEPPSSPSSTVLTSAAVDGSAASPSKQPTTTVAQPAPVPAAFPTSMVAIRGGEVLLLIDTSNGASSTLIEFDLFVDAENQTGQQFLFSVDVDPYNSLLAYDTCCDVDENQTHWYDLAGRAAVSSTQGVVPSVGGRGRLLATSDTTTIAIEDTTSGERNVMARAATEWFVGRTAWNSAGTVLAAEVQAAEFAGSSIALIGAQSQSLDDATLLAPPNDKAWTLPSFRHDDALVVVESSLDGSAHTRLIVIDWLGNMIDTVQLTGIGSILDVDHDASGQWLLVVDGEGDAFWFGPGGAGRLPGSRYNAASW